ncbi:MAG: exodeoxyribonuclease V subunit alpha [Actinobacteria bacterium]|nr:exodeoxyribonuclease V subunit alpha [Actinomycetota bacterium]
MDSIYCIHRWPRQSSRRSMMSAQEMGQEINQEGYSYVTGLIDYGILSSTERLAADLIARRWQVSDPVISFATAIAVWADRTGHVGVDLSRIEIVLGQARRTPGNSTPANTSDVYDVDGLPPLPSAQAIRTALRSRPDIVRLLPDSPGTHAQAAADLSPLVLWRDRLYTQRQFVDERSVAEQIQARCVDAVIGNRAAADAFLDTAAKALDESQRGAVEMVLSRRLTIITGGPGTGKTYTLARALGALLSAEPNLEIALCAPTGKAATRMQESIAAAIDEDFGVTAETLSALKPLTIHGLLGARGISTRFRHDAARPLRHDVVVIDEASMVSLQLTARTLEAINPNARIVLIGDPDQLSSVEAGSVLGDIADAEGSSIRASISTLSTGHRAGEAIVTLAQAIRDGDEAAVREAFANSPDRLVLVETNKSGPTNVAEHLANAIAASISARNYAVSGDGVSAHAASVSHRVLCGHRAGPAGVSDWNDYFQQSIGCTGSNYAGRPLIITQNNPVTGLVNGDTGIMISRGGRTQAWFPPRQAGSEPMEFQQVQLPPVETAFAITIHKSQGSEYRHVIVVLPPDGSPLLTRELLYTAITRAKESVTLIGTASALTKAIGTVTERGSGLIEALS